MTSIFFLRFKILVLVPWSFLRLVECAPCILNKTITNRIESNQSCKRRKVLRIELPMGCTLRDVTTRLIHLYLLKSQPHNQYGSSLLRIIQMNKRIMNIESDQSLIRKILGMEPLVGCILPDSHDSTHSLILFNVKQK